MQDDSLFVAKNNEYLRQAAPRVYEIGLRFSVLRPGFVEATLPFEGNQNHFGAVYAGFIFTVAEVLGGAIHATTFDPRTHYALVRGFDIDFLAPARSDLTAVAQLADVEVARIRQELPAGKVDFDLAATVRDASGVGVARTVGKYRLRPLAPLSDRPHLTS